MLGESQKPGKYRLCISKGLIIPLEKAPSPSPQSPFWQTASPAKKVGASGEGEPRAAWRWFGKTIGCGFQNKEVTVSTHFREGSGLVLSCGKGAAMPPFDSAAQTPPPSLLLPASLSCPVNSVL